MRASILGMPVSWRQRTRLAAAVIAQGRAETEIMAHGDRTSTYEGRQDIVRTGRGSGWLASKVK